MKKESGAPIQRVIFWITVAVLACSPAVRDLQASPGNRPHYRHVAINEDLPVFLHDFLTHFGFIPVISDKVGGKISGDFEISTGLDPKGVSLKPFQTVAYAPSGEIGPMHQFPVAFFDEVSKQYGLIWYPYKYTMYVYTMDEMQSEMISLGSIDIDELRSVLDSMGVSQARYPLTSAKGQNFAYVSGPPFYLTMVKQVAARMSPGKKKRRSRAAAKAHKPAEVKDSSQPVEELRSFPLKYAWADDRVFNFRSEAITVPGVATLLQNLMMKGGPVSMKAGRRVQPKRNTLPKLKGQGLAKSKSNTDDAPSDSSAADEIYSWQGGEGGPQILPDTRLNAVIIRDTANRMVIYEKLIESLDQPSGLVEIKASIIDVNADKVSELGINWRQMRSYSDDVQIQTGFNAGESLFYGNPNLAIGEGLLVGTILGSATDYFLSTIRALKNQGAAEILSRPSVLTLNNNEAIFEEVRTVHVRVAGNEEVDLFNISVGVLVKVTPHIIATGKGHKIKLSIEVRDGQLSDYSVDGIPVVEESSINTQAVINANESLLIGGTTSEQQYRNESKVPLLGDIPLLGAAFKSKKDQKIKRERLFLISPRIIDPDDALEIPSRRGREIFNNQTIEKPAAADGSRHHG